MSRRIPTNYDGESVMNVLKLSYLTTSIMRLENLLRTLSVETPTRTTIRQLYTFASIAKFNAEGKLVTLTEVKQRAGDHLGEPVLGPHVNRSYQIFLSPEEARDTEALGWISRQTNPNDRRESFIMLTPKGREIITQFSEMMGGANGMETEEKA